MYITEISKYLVLGNGYNIQSGYVTKSGYSLDLKYEKLNKEFENKDSVLSNQEAYTLGLTKYFKANNLKIQSAVTSTNVEKVKTVTAQLSVQVVF